MPKTLLLATDHKHSILAELSEEALNTLAYSCYGHMVVARQKARQEALQRMIDSANDTARRFNEAQRIASSLRVPPTPGVRPADIRSPNR